MELWTWRSRTTSSNHYSCCGRWTCHGHGLFISCASSSFQSPLKFSIGILNVAWYHTYLCPYILTCKWNIRLTHPHGQSKLYKHECRIFFYKPLLLTLSVFWWSFLWSPRANQWHQAAARNFPSLSTHLNVYFPPLPTFNIMLIKYSMLINYSMAPTKMLKRTQKPPHLSSLVFQSRWRDDLSLELFSPMSIYLSLLALVGQVY